MSGANRQVEVHYINTGFPFTVAETFMNFFEDLIYAPAGLLHDEERAYSPSHTNSYKFELYGPGSSIYYSPSHAYEVNDHVLRTEGSGRTSDRPSVMNHDEHPTLIVPGSRGADTAHAIPVECIQGQHNANSPQVFWQDNIDPDNMTYEELLDLGEAVGTQNRGLCQARISSLPVTKYKCCFFSRRKKRHERCVICQMEYKRREKQMTLPCKHVYHASCATRWLSINKACPICYIEVFGDEHTKH